MYSKFLKNHRGTYTHRTVKLYGCLRLCPSGERTSGASPTHSPGWIWSQIRLPPPPPQHPGQWPPGPSVGAAVAPLSLKMPSLPLPCQQAWWSPVERKEPSCFLPLGPIPPSPGLIWSGRLLTQAQQRSCLITESSSLAVQSPASGATSTRSSAKDCKAGKVQQILGKSAPNTWHLNNHLQKISRDLGNLQGTILVAFPSCTR